MIADYEGGGSWMFWESTRTQAGLCLPAAGGGGGGGSSSCCNGMAHVVVMLGSDDEPIRVREVN